jgi:hypothetical protein
MKHKTTALDWIFSLLSVAMLILFALPKVLGVERSVKGFQDFAPALGLPAKPFMLFTGYAELAIAALFVVALAWKQRHSLVTFGANAMLLATMVTGLFIEFFARTEPKNLLVGVAIVFTVFAAIQVKRHWPLEADTIPNPA